MQDIASQVYRKLKEKIIFLRYPPGTSLNIRQLAKELSVSPTPVREALLRLNGEGLVRRPPGNAAYVSEISVQNFKDITEIRLSLINLLGRLAVKRITQEETEEMEELIRRLREVQDRSEALNIGSEFFRTIYQATKNEPLTRILQTLHNQVSRLWFLMPEEMTPSTELIEDYESILAALRARDERACIEALRENKLTFVRLVKQTIHDEFLHE